MKYNYLFVNFSCKFSYCKLVAEVAINRKISKRNKSILCKFVKSTTMQLSTTLKGFFTNLQ